MSLLLIVIFIAILGFTLFFLLKDENRSSSKGYLQAKVEECWSGAERRKHLRFTKDLDVFYIITKKPRLKNCRTIDISEGGVRLLLEEKLPEGTLLKLRIIIPDLHKEVEAEGKIAWSSEVSDKGENSRRLFQSGVKFTGIKEGPAKKFSRYISSLREGPDTSA